MGVMLDGVYHIDDGVIKTAPDGQWSRAASGIRNWITRDGRPGPTGVGGFAAEAGRYHLYAAWNCPWAHRALLARAIKGLNDLIDVSYALPRRTPQGWVFGDDGYRDRVHQSRALHELYSRGVDGYTGRITVPVLYDKKTDAIVSNESADIVRMFNSAFEACVPESPDLFPAEHAEQIEAWNTRIYETVNNGVYRAGFASTQQAYQTAAEAVFETLDAIDAHLARTDYLVGNRFTEADLRLFPTLARFDVAYHYAFKCNLKRLTDYAFLWPYARKIFHMPGLAETVRFDIYKQGYFSPSENRNPLGIVPIGPVVDWSLPSQ